MKYKCKKCGGGEHYSSTNNKTGRVARNCKPCHKERCRKKFSENYKKVKARGGDLTLAQVDEVCRLYSEEIMTPLRISRIMGFPVKKIRTVVPKGGLLTVNREPTEIDTRKHIDGQGYVRYTVRPGEPFYSSSLKRKGPRTVGYILEHRLVMAQKLGRPLTKTEVVHHKNHIKHDNRSENLVLFSCSAAHSRFHKEENKLT